MAPSAFSLSAIDPSMSVWSKPTPETAAAASAAKEKAGETAQENSLRGIADDYPTLMPSSALDLPISETEAANQTSQKAESEAGATAADAKPRGDVDRKNRDAAETRDDKLDGPYKNRIVSAPSPLPLNDPRRPRMPSTGAAGVQRQNSSYGYPSAYSSYDGSVPSPYNVHASLPFAPATGYSPTVSHAHLQQQPVSASAMYAGGAYGSHSGYAHGFTSATQSPTSTVAGGPAAGHSAVPGQE